MITRDGSCRCTLLYNTSHVCDIDCDGKQIGPCLNKKETVSDKYKHGKKE
jgi:hypothetical protein